MILKHTEKVSSSQILNKSSGNFVVTEKCVENLIDDFKLLKLEPPEVIGSNGRKVTII